MRTLRPHFNSKKPARRPKSLGKRVFALAILTTIMALARPGYAALPPEPSSLYGLWMGVQGSDTVLHDYNADGRLIILHGNKAKQCAVVGVYRFRVAGKQVTFVPTKDRGTYSRVTLRKLDANTMEQVPFNGGRKSNKVMAFRRLHGHPCDLATADDINPAQRASTSAFLKALSYLLLFYFLFVFGSFVVVLRNLFNPRFIFPFLKEWIGVTACGCLILYGSAYGFFYNENHHRLLVEGQVNPGFSLFIPYQVSYGEGVVAKDTLRFWGWTLFCLCFYQSFPTIAWRIWRKQIFRARFLQVAILWGIRTYAGLLLLVYTLTTVTSVVSPSGPYSWLALLVGFAGLVKFMKPTFNDIDDVRQVLQPSQ